MAKDKVNKSQLIRDYKKAHPTAKGSHIAAALMKHGVNVGLVYNVLAPKGKKKGKKAADSNGAMETAVKLVSACGGFEAARTQLNTLEGIYKLMAQKLKLK